MYKPLPCSHAKTSGSLEPNLQLQLSSGQSKPQELSQRQVRSDLLRPCEEVQAVQRGQPSGGSQGDHERAVNQQVEYEAQHPRQDPEGLDEEAEHQVRVHPPLPQQGEEQQSRRQHGQGELQQHQPRASH